MPPALQTTTRDSSFASTRWAVVRHAADSQTASQHALTELCQIYWRPVYVFLRRQGIPQHDAQDPTQGFFADLIDSRRTLAPIRRKVSFARSYLEQSNISWRTRAITTVRKSAVAVMCRCNWMRRRFRKLKCTPRDPTVRAQMWYSNGNGRHHSLDKRWIGLRRNMSLAARPPCSKR